MHSNVAPYDRSDNLHDLHGKKLDRVEIAEPDNPQGNALRLNQEAWIYVVKRSSVSTSKLNPLLSLHIWPINLVVFKGTLPIRERNLISEMASRLDAFSVYPFRT